jgi:hypothetical protein
MGSLHAAIGLDNVEYGVRGHRCDHADRCGLADDQREHESSGNPPKGVHHTHR